jgi:hypothetical protein
MSEALIVVYIGTGGITAVTSTAMGEAEQKRAATLFDRIKGDIVEFDRSIAAKCQVQQPADDADYILPIFTDGKPI